MASATAFRYPAMVSEAVARRRVMQRFFVAVADALQGPDESSCLRLRGLEHHRRGGKSVSAAAAQEAARRCHSVIHG